MTSYRHVRLLNETLVVDVFGFYKHKLSIIRVCLLHTRISITCRFPGDLKIIHPMESMPWPFQGEL